MSGSFLEKDLVMCCPAASVYILWYIMHHSINSMQNHSFHKRLSCLRLHTDFCDYVNSFPRDIQRLCCENPWTWENCLRVRETGCRIFWIQKICHFFWENLPDIFGQICQFLLGSLPSIKEINCLLWKNPSPTLRKSATHTKSATDFGKMSHRLWENQPPTLRKAVTNFGEMPSPILGKSVTDLRKSVTDFGEIRHRLWGNPSPTFRKSVANFGESGRQFCQAPWQNRSVLVKNWDWLGFCIGLGQSSSLTVLNATNVWVEIFEGLGLGVTKNKSTSGKLEG